MKNQNIKCVFCSTSLKLTQTFTKHLQESCVGVKMPLKFITIFVGPLSQFGETEFGFRQMTLRKRWPVFPMLSPNTYPNPARCFFSICVERTGAGKNEGSDVPALGYVGLDGCVLRGE